MASYTYPSNPVAPPPPNQGQSAYPNYGAYANQAQDNQWGQTANAVYGQSAPAAYPTAYDQHNAYGAQQQTPQNYQASAQAAAAAEFNNTFNSSYGQKGGNFRGNNAGNMNRNSGPGYNKGPRNNFGAQSGMEEQQDTIFVSGLPEDTSEDELKDYFGSIGLIKIDKKTRKPKIWIYKDKETGKPKGEVTVTYDDPPTASSAISWFNQKPFKGAILNVQLAQRKNNYLDKGGRGGYNSRPPRDFGDRKNDRNNSGGGSGGSSREGDWVCQGCQNNNFAWRNSCNRCKEQRPASSGGGGGGGGNSVGLPYERRGGGGPMNGRGGDRGSFGGQRNNRGSYGGRDNQRGGGSFRGRSNPY